MNDARNFVHQEKSKSLQSGSPAPPGKGLCSMVKTPTVALQTIVIARESLLRQCPCANSDYLSTIKGIVENMRPQQQSFVSQALALIILSKLRSYSCKTNPRVPEFSCAAFIYQALLHSTKATCGHRMRHPSCKDSELMPST